MKLLPTLLLNLLVAGAVVFAYDMLRTQHAAPAAPPGENASAELEARIAALESAKPVELRTDGAPAALLRRIEALEAERGQAAAARAAPASDPEGAEASHAASKSGAVAEPSETEIERARKVLGALRSREKARKEAAWITAALAKAEVRLTEKEQGQVLKAHHAFAARRNQVWSEAKARGAEQGDAVDWSTIIRETQASLRDEFAEELGAFLPAQDAEAVAAALQQGGK